MFSCRLQLNYTRHIMRLEAKIKKRQQQQVTGPFNIWSAALALYDSHSINWNSPKSSVPPRRKIRTVHFHGNVINKNAALAMRYTNNNKHVFSSPVSCSFSLRGLVHLPISFSLYLLIEYSSIVLVVDIHLPGTLANQWANCTENSATKNDHRRLIVKLRLLFYVHCANELNSIQKSIGACCKSPLHSIYRDSFIWRRFA